VPPPPARAPEPAPPARVAAPVEAAPASGAQVESIEERIRRRSSPLVRKIAQEHAIEVGDVDGTGIHNRVTKNDILSYLENRTVAAAPRPSRHRCPRSDGPSRPGARACPALDLVTERTRSSR
jgi:2-oxoglutarate dehydrogenase E2 component (dihydrolipoamide succinyltransferase)